MLLFWEPGHFSPNLCRIAYPPPNTIMESSFIIIILFMYSHESFSVTAKYIIVIFKFDKFLNIVYIYIFHDQTKFKSKFSSFYLSCQSQEKLNYITSDSGTVQYQIVYDNVRRALNAGIAIRIRWKLGLYRISGLFISGIRLEKLFKIRNSFDKFVENLIKVHSMLLFSRISGKISIRATLLYPWCLY